MRQVYNYLNIIWFDLFLSRWNIQGGIDADQPGKIGKLFTHLFQEF